MAEHPRSLGDDDVVVETTGPELLRMVDSAFAVTARDLAAWPDPHARREPDDDEYSRVSDAGKWKIIGARADAWLVAVEKAGIAVVQRAATAVWEVEPRTQVSRVDLALPRRPGALPLVVARSRLGDVDDAGVTFGLGDPAVCVGWLPECGCDACDSGSQNELDQVDRLILGIVSGTFRRLTRGRRQITQLDSNGTSTSGGFGRGEAVAVLANPRGWQELSGPSWLSRE